MDYTLKVCTIQELLLQVFGADQDRLLLCGDDHDETCERTALIVRCACQCYQQKHYVLEVLSTTTTTTRVARLLAPGSFQWFEGAKCGVFQSL